MKKLICSAILLGAIAVCALADGLLDPIKLDVDNVYTNGGGSKAYTTPQKVSGEVVGIVLDIAGYATPTVNVTIATAATGTMGVAQTLLSTSSNTADAVYPVTDIKCTTAGVDISNVPAPIRLYGDYVTMTVTNLATNATTDVTAYLLLLR